MLSIYDMVNTAAHLTIVESTPKKSRPQYFNTIAEGTLLDRFFIYSKPDFAAGAAAYDVSRAFETNGGQEAFPMYNDTEFTDLGGEFTKEQVQTALKKQAEQEDPQITQLRTLIVESVEKSKRFWDATRTVEEAEQNGFTIDGMAPGILAYDS